MHLTSRVQYDLTLRHAIALRCFYVRGKRWSFHTTKTQSRHGLRRAITQLIWHLLALGIYLGNRIFAEVTEVRRLVSLTLIVSGFALLVK